MYCFLVFCSLKGYLLFQKLLSYLDKVVFFFCWSESLWHFAVFAGYCWRCLFCSLCCGPTCCIFMACRKRLSKLHKAIKVKSQITVVWFLEVGLVAPSVVTAFVIVPGCCGGNCWKQMPSTEWAEANIPFPRILVSLLPDPPFGKLKRKLPTSDGDESRYGFGFVGSPFRKCGI